MSLLAASFPLLPEQASSHAARVDALTLFELGVLVFFTVLIAALVIGFAVKWRQRRLNQPATAQTDSHSTGAIAIEITWTVIPLLIVLVMFLAGAKVFMESQQPPANSMSVNVVGKQWMWKVQHPSGAREINELHVPIGRPISLTMISQDVIHDFGLPAFRIKQDVLPGRYTRMWFTPTKPGTYHLFCDQYCGTEHSKMVGTVTVLDEAGYAAWVNGVPKDLPPVKAGEQLFSQFGCVTCHGARGPTMAGLFGRHVKLDDGSTVLANEDYIRESIIAPSAKLVAGYPPIMPSFKGQLSEEQIMDLVAYIKSLAGATADPFDPQAAPEVGGAGSATTLPTRAIPGPGPFVPQRNLSKP